MILVGRSLSASHLIGGFALPRLRSVLVAAILLHPIWLYATASVDCLKTVCSYTYAGHSLQAGLGLDNAPLPPFLRQATHAQEDREFYRHHGVDPGRIWGHISHGSFRGSSTITQQLVKNVFTGPQKTLWRKYVEAVYALKVERTLNKDEILLLYSNLAQTGPDLFGYRAGARAYFGKEPEELSQVEAVALVAVLPDPVGRTEWIREGKPMPPWAENGLAWRLSWFEPREEARRDVRAFAAKWGR